MTIRFGRGTGKTGSGVGDAKGMLVGDSITGVGSKGTGLGIPEMEQARPANIISITPDRIFIVTELIRIFFQNQRFVRKPRLLWLCPNEPEKPYPIYKAHIHVFDEI